MSTQAATTYEASSFTAREWQALRALRDRYARHRDLFAARDIAHLHFLRWLVQTGRLQP